MKRLSLKLAIVLLRFSSLAIPSPTIAQPVVPDQTPPATSQPPPAVDRPVSLKLLLPNIVSDQGRIWSFPARLVQGKDLLPTAVILGATAGLVAADPTTAGYFRGTTAFHGFNTIFTSNATLIGTIAVPVSLYAVGHFRKDSKMQHTALLAGEAVADAEILSTFLKDATNRVRPSGVPSGGNLSDSWFENVGSRLRGGSFPSGHTITAFAVATVIARRYGNHRWVPYVSYGMAALVGLSRVTLSAHYLSDVFVGGALGYTISRFTVLRE